MPFTVAETPARLNGTGIRLSRCVDGARPAPSTAIGIPGANPLFPVATLFTLEIVMPIDAPTTIVTGMLIAPGLEFCASNDTTARYTPFAKPKVDARSVA